MKWVEFSVRTPSEFVEPLSQIFARYGDGVVAVEPDQGFDPDEGETASSAAWATLRTYVPLNDSIQERRGQIDVGVRLVSHVSNISPLRERVLDEEEWSEAWKEHFHVLRVGRRIVIVPSWRKHSPKRSDLVIDLDPGMAFGTGHHPTTRMCLEQLEDRVSAGMDVLDMGCGSGILSIAAAKLGARKVIGLEVDSTSAGVARQNSRRNGVQNTVQVYQGTLPHPGVAPRGFDIAVANISARVVSEKAGELVAAVRPGGTLVASGIVVDHRAGLTQRLEELGIGIEGSYVDGDWVTLTARVP